MLVADNRERSEMTEFGKTLNKVMVNHDVYNWQQLRTRLDAVGYRIGQSRLSQYLYGKRNPQNPQEFFDALTEALDLNKEEEMRLVYAFAYPRRGSTAPKLTEENIERANAFEEEMGACHLREDEGDEGNKSGGQRV